MKRKLLLIFIVACIPFAILAQEYGPKNEYKSVGNFVFISKIDNNTNIDIVKVFKSRENLHFQDAQPARFLLLDQQKKFAFGIGGMARFVGGSEFGGIINTSTNQGFQPALIAMPQGDFPRSQLRMSAATSQIFFKLVGKTKKLGNIETYISTNFQGNNYAPQLRQAYISFMGFTIGQAWSTMTDLSGYPPTIDYAGPNGLVFMLNPMIRYAGYFAKGKVKYAAALEFPSVNATYGTFASNTPQSAPDVIGYMQFNWNKQKSHVRLTGIMRNMAYKDITNKKTDVRQGWGAQLTGVTALTSKWSMFYQFIYGEGIGSYINDMSVLKSDMVPNPHSNGCVQTLPMWGLTGGLQYNISKTVFMSASYGQARLYTDKGYDMMNQYKYGQYIVANTFWNATPSLQLGIEYLRGIKALYGGDKGHANRVNLMAQYSF